MESRGGGWVVAQFALIALVVVACFVPPAWPDAVSGILTVLGVLLVVCGVALAGWAARVMGRSLTPFPKPEPGARLVEDGPFGIVRHPVYAGALLLLLGVSLATTISAALVTGALALLWTGKLRVEESHLREVFPEYEGYARRVPARLVPRVY
jgi:protein-S-isoprenylcysteine O-methyltransferase Ste14